MIDQANILGDSQRSYKMEHYGNQDKNQNRDTIGFDSNFKKFTFGSDNPSDFNRGTIEIQDEPGAENQ